MCFLFYALYALAFLVVFNNKFKGVHVMKKRFLSALLVLFTVLFQSPMSVVAETGNEISAETGDPYIYVYEMPPDIYEEWYGVPDEVLALNTPNLLEAFLQSGRLQGLYWAASTAAAFENGLERISDYKEFAELVSRTDFIPTIETYAKEIMINSQNLSQESEDMLMGFKILLRCEAVKSLMASSPDILSDCSYLQEIYDSFTTSFPSSESRSVEDISYANAGIYTTEGNKSTVLYTASRELAEDEKTAANNQYADICNLCGTRTNSTFKSKICSGPPCPAILLTEPKEDE